MTKGTKKTNRRLKKTVRKTLGTLFLISAIVVAAIPTEGLQAEGDTATQAAAHTHATTHTPNSGSYTYKVSLAKDSTEKGKQVSPTSTVPTMADLIPEIKDTDNIYTTGTNADGSNYQFAYVLYKNVWSAVILGYNTENNLPDNTLTIPDTVSAYIQPTRNLGTVNGYVAASQTGEPLYYEAFTEHIRQVDDPDKPILDTAGLPTGKFEKKMKYIIPERCFPAIIQIIHGKSILWKISFIMMEQAVIQVLRQKTILTAARRRHMTDITERVQIRSTSGLKMRK